MDNQGRVVAVFGSSRREENTRLYDEGYELGRLLAEAGYTVMTGGYGGSMAAVSRGAAEAGGRVVGVTCGVFGPLSPNRWLSEEVQTPDLLARLGCLMERADAYVALRGGIGTLAEVTVAWSLVQTRSVVGKPLVLIGGDWRLLVDAFLAHSDLGSSIAALAQVVDTPVDAVRVLASPAPTPPGPPPLG